MSTAKKGKPQSEAHIRKRVEARRGYSPSMETREKIRATLKMKLLDNKWARFA